MRKNNMFFVMIMIVSMVAFFVFYDTATLDIAAEYIGLIPSMMLIVICIYGVKNASGSTMRVGAYLMLGVGFALMSGVLNTMGMLIPDILTASLTLQYLQILIVVVCTIIGVAAN